MALTLEIVEGPGAGRQIGVDRTLTIGRGADVDVTIDDPQASRRHVRVHPESGGLVVEDLGSSNGTLVARTPVHGAALLSVGQDLQLGVTVLALRTAREVAAQPSAVREVPPALLAPVKAPSYVPPDALREPRADFGDGETADLDSLLDVRVKARAKAAPVAVFALAALAILILLAVT